MGGCRRPRSRIFRGFGVSYVVGFFTWSLGGVGFGDNVYTLRDSEVVSTGCYNASLVSYSADWTLGALSASATCI